MRRNLQWRYGVCVIDPRKWSRRYRMLVRLARWAVAESRQAWRPGKCRVKADRATPRPHVGIVAVLFGTFAPRNLRASVLGAVMNIWL
jgi:hypothetical protein